MVDLIAYLVYFLVTFGIMAGCIWWVWFVIHMPQPKSPVYRAAQRVKPEPEGPYLRKWTASRKLDARREQAIWQKYFDTLSH